MPAAAPDLHSDEEPELRDVRRWAVRLPTRISMGGLTPETARILNLSHSGMLIGWHGYAAVGDSFEVELVPGEIRRARVVWCDDSLFGCRFNHPLSQAVLSAALLRSLQSESRSRIQGEEDSIQPSPIDSLASSGAAAADLEKDTGGLSGATLVKVRASLAVADWAVPALAGWLLG